MTLLPDDELKAVRDALEAGAKALSRQAATDRKYEAEVAKEFDGLVAEIAAGLCAQDAEKHAATLRALLRHIDALQEQLVEASKDAERMNKLAGMAIRGRVTISDTGVIPYRVCLNGQVLGNSIREVIDKAIVSELAMRDAIDAAKEGM